MSRILTITFWIIVIASFPAIIWFFKFRKVMIEKQILVINAIENALKPRDKRYWLLGYLVGFRAKYWINRGGIKRAWALYVTPPYHIFFYLPAIILLKKKERLEVTIEMDGIYNVKGEGHLYDPKERSAVRSVRKDVRSTKNLKKIDLTLNGTKYSAIYRGEDMAERLKDLFYAVQRYANVYRISIDLTKKVIHISFDPKDVIGTSKTIESLIEFAKSLRAKS